MLTLKISQEEAIEKGGSMARKAGIKAADLGRLVWSSVSDDATAGRKVRRSNYNKWRNHRVAKATWEWTYDHDDYVVDIDISSRELSKIEGLIGGKYHDKAPQIIKVKVPYRKVYRDKDGNRVENPAYKEHWRSERYLEVRAIKYEYQVYFPSNKRWNGWQNPKVYSSLYGATKSVHEWLNRRYGVAKQTETFEIRKLISEAIDAKRNAEHLKERGLESAEYFLKNAKSRLEQMEAALEVALKNVEDAEKQVAEKQKYIDEIDQKIKEAQIKASMAELKVDLAKSKSKNEVAA
jgi:hypothetical protein